MSGLEELLTGRTLVKRYRIGEVIGRGGFAAVYRAEDERLGRPVAVKVITAAAPTAPVAERHRERFEREARAAASLPQHPNVVTVHDFGVDPELGLDFLVMEFLHGEDLATRLRRMGRPSLDDALCILRDAAAGIAVGHRAGIVHRDVKPGNIFLAQAHGTEAFRVCILDFGIARVLDDDQTLTRVPGNGTPLSPAYASPEQSRGVRDLTTASDVFSLGVVAYQLLTGEKPFVGPRSADPSGWIAARAIRELNPDVPTGIEAVISRALAYAPEDRFADADDLAMALASAADAEAMAVGAIPALASSPAGPLHPEAVGQNDDATVFQEVPEAVPAAARHRVVFAQPPAPPIRSRGRWLLVIILLATVTGAGWWFLGGRRQAPPLDPDAAADLEAISEGLENATAAEAPIPVTPDQRSSEPESFEARVADAPPRGDTLPLDATASPSPSVTDSAPTDTAVAPSSPPDSLLVSPDSALPPPRILGVPVDSAA